MLDIVNSLLQSLYNLMSPYFGYDFIFFIICLVIVFFVFIFLTLLVRIKIFVHDTIKVGFKEAIKNKKEIFKGEIEYIKERSVKFLNILLIIFYLFFFLL